ncbi:plasmid transfer protein TraA [Streptomyces sp. NPDC059009]|uniref:plasmid transfer protein TraA n=1 Tax=Streptomyces sp. NPDC059009 TaxID=3346694 RepID=UPI00368808B0
MATNGTPKGEPQQVPVPPEYPPSNRSEAVPRRKGGSKVHINKVGLVPDVSLPPMSFNYHRTTVVQGARGGAGGKQTPGSGFTSDEDIRAYCESLRKGARPRAVERSLDAEVLESSLRNIPDTQGRMSGSRARARRVTRHLKRIAAAEKLIAKQASALWATFTREYEAELAQISSGRRHGDPRYQPRRRNSSFWKQF